MISFFFSRKYKFVGLRFGHFVLFFRAVKEMSSLTQWAVDTKPQTIVNWKKLVECNKNKNTIYKTKNMIHDHHFQVFFFFIISLRFVPCCFFSSLLLYSHLRFNSQSNRNSEKLIRVFELGRIFARRLFFFLTKYYENPTFPLADVSISLHIAQAHKPGAL